MKEEKNLKNKYEINIQVYPNDIPNRVEVSKCEDTWFDLGLLLEGIGVLIGMLEKNGEKKRGDTLEYINQYLAKAVFDDINYTLKRKDF